MQGTPGQGQDLASLLGNLGNQFSTLLNDPTNQTQQSAVVSAAGTLATQINTLSDTYTAQRQSAQNAIVAEVGTLNSALSTIGALSNQIMAAKAAGTSTADLQNQRNARSQTLAQTAEREHPGAAERRHDRHHRLRHRTADARAGRSAVHQRGQRPAGLLLSGRRHPADHAGRDGRDGGN